MSISQPEANVDLNRPPGAVISFHGRLGTVNRLQTENWKAFQSRSRFSPLLPITVTGVSQTLVPFSFAVHVLNLLGLDFFGALIHVGPQLLG